VAQLVHRAKECYHHPQEAQEEMEEEEGVVVVQVVLAEARKKKKRRNLHRQYTYKEVDLSQHHDRSQPMESQ
jgi:hypothetical protein